MKKLYSIVLMAVVLLVSTNMWAETYTANVGTTAEFEAAWAQSATKDVVINLTSDAINLSKTMWLGTENINDAPHTVEINMGGYPFKSSNATCAFLLTHGTLKINGNAQFTAEGKNAFYVTGSTNKNVDPSDDNANFFSHLEIGDGVIVAHTYYDAAITVDGIWKSNIAYKADANNVIPSKPALTYIANVYAGKTNKYTTDAKAEENSSKCVANGVRVDLKGTINGRKYGIKTNGILGNPTWYEQQTYKKDDHTVAYSTTLLPAGYVIAETDVNYSPYVHIYPTGRIVVQDKDDVHAAAKDKKNPIAVYASGYARWLVEGYAEGCTGANIKSGVVDFNDATVVGSGEVYNAATESSSGSTASGSAIVITTSGAYAGDIDVNIGGDSKVSATNGYAIEEQVLAANQQTKVDSLTITGGTFQGGSIPNPVDPTQGNIDAVMSISVPTAIAAASTEEETTITIIGGTTSAGQTTIGDQTLADFLSNATTEAQQGQTHLTQVEVEPGKTIWVISEGTAPVDAEDQGVADWGSTVNWKHALDGDTDPMTDTIWAKTMVNHGGATTLVLDELQIISTDCDQTLVIMDGYALEVGRVLLGSRAKIIVEAGAKFIVKGEQGITAPVVDNIVLKHNSTTGKYATFLFNPAVTSNRHPNATVEFTTNAWFESSTSKQWEWFGIPTYNAAKSISATCPAFVAVYENGGWSDIGLISDINTDPTKLAKLNKPFAAYDLLANRAHDAADPEITISGELVGNINAPLNVDSRWSPFANSYTAEVDAEAFVNALKGSSNIKDAIWVAKQNTNGTITWNVKADEKLDGLKLQPMQAFMLNNPKFIEDASINYASMVYAPAVPGYTPAPRRTMAAPYSAQITINVANAEGTWDDVDVLEGTEAKAYEKFLNSDVNIYVADGEKNDYIVAEDLEGTYVGFSTVNGGNFTISFDGVKGNEFMLVDHETDAEVLMVEGNTYEFAAAANSANDYRFEIVSPRKVTTAIENAEAVKSAKGIYTITGQYMGEMNVWNSLPAGVYVVNGEKRVK